MHFFHLHQVDSSTSTIRLVRGSVALLRYFPCRSKGCRHLLQTLSLIYDSYGLLDIFIDGNLLFRYVMLDGRIEDTGTIFYPLLNKVA